MQNLLPKATVLAMIAGGLGLTGDLGWIANRGLRVLDAADVALPIAAEVEQPGGLAAPQALAPAAPGLQPRPVPAEPAAQARPVSAIAAALIKPPAGGCAEVVWQSLRPGDRVSVWLAAPGPRCLVLDVVDPIAGEALAYEAAAVSADGRPLAAATPPCRVLVGRSAGQSAPAALAKGGMLQLAPAGIATAGEAGRWLGPIEALIVLR